MKFAFLSHLDFNLFKFRLPIMKSLVDAGHEVFAICPEGEFSRHFEDSGISHVTYFLDRRSFNPAKELYSVFSIHRTLLKIKPDLLHSFIAKPNIYGCFAARFHKKMRVVCSITGLGSFFLKANYSASTILIKFLYKLALKRADKVIFQNKDDQAFFVENGLIDAKKLKLIGGSGVDNHFFVPGPEKDAGSVLTIGMIARFSKEKGLFEFVRAAELMKKEMNCRFMLVGWPDFGSPGSITQEEFNCLKQNKAVEVFEFQGNVKEFLHQFDIYCLPSYREGLPMSVLEAMACGLPIITTDAPGCRETVEDGINGYLVATGNVDGIVHAIKRFAEQPSLLRQFGRESRIKVCQEFSLKSVRNEHLRLYKSLLGQI